MKRKLKKFLRYLQIERGFSQGTIEAYQLDIERGLIPFLHQHGKSEIAEVTKDDIRAYLDYLVVNRDNSSVTRARKLATSGIGGELTKVSSRLKPLLYGVRALRRGCYVEGYK